MSNSHCLDISLGELASSEEGLSPSQSDQDDDNDPDGPYAFRRKKNCSYHEPRLDGMGNWPWASAEEGGSEDKRFRFCLTSIPGPDKRQRCIGFARRRIGRGGRVVFDRAWTPLDDHLPEIDNIFASRPNGLPSTNELVSEIRNEWKFFRPKSLSLSDDDNQDQGVSASDEFSPFRRDSSTSRPSSSENTVLDSPEDELFELQRKQLEQLKPEDSQPVVVFGTDHSYSSLPTSCFNVASTTYKTPAQYHNVSAELSEDSCSPTNPLFPSTISAVL